MDFYQMMFGRPSPGRTLRPRRLRYLDGAEDPQVSFSADGVEAARGYEPPDSPQWARDASEARAQERRNVDAGDSEGAARVPFRAAAGRDVRPFGNDFAAWSDSVDAAERPRRGSALAGAPEEPSDPVSPARLEPESAPGAERNVDLGAEWRAAEARSEARWREGKPSPADMLFALIYGRQGRRAQVAQENEDMREQIAGRD